MASVEDFSELDGMADRRPHLGLRLRRHAQQGRRRRDGERGGIPAVICNGTEAGTLAAAATRTARSAPASRRAPARRPASSSGSSTRSRHAAGSLVDDGRGPGPARERLQPAAGGDRRVHGDFEAGDAVEVDRGRRGCRQRDRRLLGHRAVAVIGLKTRRGPGAAPARRRRGDPPRPLRVGLAARRRGLAPPCIRLPQVWSADRSEQALATLTPWRLRPIGHRDLRSRQACRAGPRQRRRPRPRTRRWRRPRGCSASAAPRSSRRTPPTSPTSAPPA